jgi:hypothetical protein
MNTPDGIITLTPALQWGFAGFALILLGVIVWLVAKLLDVLKGNNQVISSNTSAIKEVTCAVRETHSTTKDLRDRVLSFHCPYSHRGPADRSGGEA